MLGADHHLGDRLGQRLALVQRDIAADFLRALAGQLTDAAQDLRALQRRGLLPAVEGPLRGGQGAVQIRGAGVRQFAQHFLRGGIDHVLLAAAAAFDELPIDIKGEVLVHGFSCVLCRESWVRWLEPGLAVRAPTAPNPLAYRVGPGGVAGAADAFDGRSFQRAYISLSRPFQKASRHDASVDLLPWLTLKPDN